MWFEMNFDKILGIEKPPKKTKAQREEIWKQFILKNAQPRPQPPPPKIDRGRKGELSAMGPKIEELSKPAAKNIYHKPKKQTYVKKEALTATASARICAMAEPMYKYVSPSKDSLNIMNRIKVKRGALTYNITEAVQKLAELPEAKRRRKKPRNPFKVKKSALKAKASARILEIAKPHIRPDPPMNKYAMKVNPKALKYKISKRINFLATPGNKSGKGSIRKTKKKDKKDDDDDED